MDKQTKEKISNRMSQVGIGEKLGVSSQAVGKWLRKGNIPPRRVIPLCQILNWEVTPHEVDPMSYPNPTDGLPNQEG
ncbi:TPA: transcriptional regulator [Klebsiella oxytoca]|uniref:YdaS family helix-turn-helix protein n=1 Tax=Klebsiella michiganensis TaxID=1134687 RepID=A0AB35Q0A3_9ENTR|nr:MULTISPECIES: YdaS family helix-turn-helix protein [Klebsiella]DAL53285.1 MAG TPA_asm: Putative antitoxin of bacterial toxin-antitoxin system, YdaS/YdaT [Caudoviricetes sp.]HBM3057509.1 helix-turn-helix domain-containing protein [Klebsiella oxytoca]KMK41197.1 hypothetical protein ABW14_15120 [Klebsiella michiganensis]MBG2586658.1 helix-turn-helix domain-containing protein [Klebsiella michiganensis]MBG2635654.1 helix-turn-helix domain-containing protein [Klebsiella michiganensis]